MIIIPLLNNAVIFVGDFLLAVYSNDATGPKVCRVSEIVNAEELIVTWYIHRDGLAEMGNVRQPPPVLMESFGNVLLCRLEEVFELRASRSVINRNDVVDLAFVFHIIALESNMPNCAGMANVFFVRYYYDESNQLKELCFSRHFPFSHVVMDSYPSRIWHTMLQVKGTIEKNLNDKKQYQMCRKMCLVSCSLESWTYLASKLVSCGALVVVFSRRNTSKRMHCDLSLSSATDRQSYILLRLDTSNSMVCARRIFGITFGVGIRNRPPSKGEPPVRMMPSDAVNFVDVASNDYDNVPVVWPDRREVFVSDQGVDFIFDKSTRTLKVRIRYKKILGSNPLIQRVLHLRVVDNNVPPVPNDLTMWTRHIVTGTSFGTEDGEVVSVLRVDGNNVICIVDGTATEVMFTLNEAANLLRRYIG